MKNIYLGLLSVCLLTACRNGSIIEDQRNIKTAQKMFEAFNKHDWQNMADYYSDDALFLDPAYGDKYVHKTRKQTAAKYAEMQHMFADIHDDVESLHAVNDVVVVQFTSSGTPKGGEKWRLPICSVLTFNGEGKIIKDATYYDNF